MNVAKLIGILCSLPLHAEVEIDVRHETGSFWHNIVDLRVIGEENPIVIIETDS